MWSADWWNEVKYFLEFTSINYEWQVTNNEFLAALSINKHFPRCWRFLIGDVLVIIASGTQVLKADFHEANYATNSRRTFCRRLCFLISTQKRILVPLSLLISYIMAPNVNTLLLFRKRILILDLMLLHRKKQKSKKSTWVRKIFQDRTKKGEFHLLVRDLSLHDHQYQCFLHSPWCQASCEAFRREDVELVSTFSSAHCESKLLKMRMRS